MSVFQERVKDLMVTNNINQKELSKLSGISEASLSRYIKGVSTPRLDILVNIANVFHVDVNTLTEPSISQVSDKDAFKETYSLVTRNKTKLTDEQKNKIIRALLSK